METLNLNTLASSLPTAQQKAEQELLNNFKAAALSITTLYRSSRQNAKRAYNAGYAAACQDLLTMIQQGVSVGGLGKPNVPAVSSNNPLSSSSLPTPSSPVLTASNHPPEPTTPSPPFAPVNTQRPTQRSSKPRVALKGEPSASYTHFPTIPSTPVFNFVPETITPVNPLPSFSETPTVPAAGMKRRHAMMMMLDTTSSPATTGSMSVTQTPSTGNSPLPQSTMPNSSRRRTKSTRGQQQQLQNQNINLIQPSAEAMDIEDDGRERKRVARR
ncbi:hypothetical protein AN958_01703 [Leucoagaricus sp. SymC.cos]|nr:hypothetical protein AN958_01703 [Leucoagaricus sp. SymC.cos]